MKKYKKIIKEINKKEKKNYFFYLGILLFLIIYTSEINTSKYDYLTSDLSKEEWDAEISKSPSGNDYIGYYKEFVDLIEGKANFFTINPYDPPFMHILPYYIIKIVGFSINKYLFSNIIWIGLIMLFLSQILFSFF